MGIKNVYEIFHSDWFLIFMMIPSGIWAESFDILVLWGMGNSGKYFRIWGIWKNCMSLVNGSFGRSEIMAYCVSCPKNYLLEM